MLKNKAQSLTEYSICLATVLLLLVTINVYIKRGLQGRYKDVTDYATTAISAKKQYEPYYQSEVSTVKPDVGIQMSFGKGGAGRVEKNIIKDSVTRDGTRVELTNPYADTN